ncbi:DMT family transporter [Roseiterribacter gracilis]|uniref:Permease n=1 Tax=Roseiterribacter gracilis TaxID=2812848 RepID=A0A8S8XCL2_9PROT|nr:permease [Rhodospirillales bacterium TMPK1]
MQLRADTTNKRDAAIGIALAIVGVLAFSMKTILVKLAYVEVQDAVTLLALRMAVSGPVFLLVALRAPGEKMDARGFGSAVLLGIIGYYGASFFDFAGLEYVSAGIGRLILFTYPTIVVLLSLAIFGTRPSKREVAALIVTYIGVGCVVSSGFTAGNKDLLTGAGLIFGSALLFSVYLIFSTNFTRRYGSLRFTAIAMCSATVLCVGQFPVLRDWSALDLSWHTYGIVIALGIGSTVLPTFAMGEALRRLGATKVALLGGLGPVSTLLISVTGLEEKMSLLQIFGAVLVLGGVLLTTTKSKTPVPVQDPD